VHPADTLSIITELSTAKSWTGMWRAATTLGVSAGILRSGTDMSKKTFDRVWIEPDKPESHSFVHWTVIQYSEDEIDGTIYFKNCNKQIQFDFDTNPYNLDGYIDVDERREALIAKMDRIQNAIKDFRAALGFPPHE
jgi:hypothetical protein